MSNTVNTELDFWRCVSDPDINDCMDWNRYITPNGYGRFDINGQRKYAHVWSYIFTYGQIDQGMQINHTCDNRKCVNPKHLYQGSQSENMRDAVDRKRNANTAKDYCNRGHLYDDENTYWYITKNRRSRNCRICNRIAKRKLT